MLYKIIETFEAVENDLIPTTMAKVRNRKTRFKRTHNTLFIIILFKFYHPTDKT